MGPWDLEATGKPLLWIASEQCWKLTHTEAPLGSSWNGCRHPPGGQHESGSNHWGLVGRVGCGQIGYGWIGRLYLLMGQWGLRFGGRYLVLTAVR